MVTQRYRLSYNRCSMCHCSLWSVSVDRLDTDGNPVDGFRLLGEAKMCRTVRVLSPDEPLYRQAYESMINEPRAAEYIEGCPTPTGWTVACPTG